MFARAKHCHTGLETTEGVDTNMLAAEQDSWPNTRRGHRDDNPDYTPRDCCMPAETVAVEAERTPGGCRSSEYLDWAKLKVSHNVDILCSEKTRWNDV